MWRQYDAEMVMGEEEKEEEEEEEKDDEEENINGPLKLI